MKGYRHGRNEAVLVISERIASGCFEGERSRVEVEWVDMCSFELPIRQQ